MPRHTEQATASTTTKTDSPQRLLTMEERLIASGHKVYNLSTLGQAFQEGFEEAKAEREAREAKAKADHQTAKEGPQK